jgi:cytochrome c oxidase subunit 2
MKHRRATNRAASPAEDRRLMVTLIIWGAMITVGLFSLTIMSFITDRSLLHAAEQPQINLTVTAHQWWWEVEYEDDNASHRFKTANEIHLPVNTQVRVTLMADDVIHSFWVPNLHGKVDLIPGRTNEIRLQPIRVGRYRGECAEFCGTQHAHMAFDVVVQTVEDYAAWRTQQLAEARAPTDATAAQGQAVFLSGACGSCHNISGTDAMGTNGPDLSHLASRLTLAAGSLPNNNDNMQRWLQDPQSIKSGNHMPTVSLAAADRDALVAYLGSLQ